MAESTRRTVLRVRAWYSYCAPMAAAILHVNMYIILRFEYHMRSIHGDVALNTCIYTTLWTYQDVYVEICSPREQVTFFEGCSEIFYSEERSLSLVYVDIVIVFGVMHIQIL